MKWFVALWIFFQTCIGASGQLSGDLEVDRSSLHSLLGKIKTVPLSDAEGRQRVMKDALHYLESYTARYPKDGEGWAVRGAIVLEMDNKLEGPLIAEQLRAVKGNVAEGEREKIMKVLAGMNLKNWLAPEAVEASRSAKEALPAAKQAEAAQDWWKARELANRYLAFSPHDAEAKRIDQLADREIGKIVDAKMKKEKEEEISAAEAKFIGTWKGSHNGLHAGNPGTAMNWTLTIKIEPGIKSGEPKVSLLYSSRVRTNLIRADCSFACPGDFKVTGRALWDNGRVSYDFSNRLFTRVEMKSTRVASGFLTFSMDSKDDRVGAKIDEGVTLRMKDEGLEVSVNRLGGIFRLLSRRFRSVEREDAMARATVDLSPVTTQADEGVMVLCRGASKTRKHCAIKSRKVIG